MATQLAASFSQNWNTTYLINRIIFFHSESLCGSYRPGALWAAPPRPQAAMALHVSGTECLTSLHRTIHQNHYLLLAAFPIKKEHCSYFDFTEMALEGTHVPFRQCPIICPCNQGCASGRLSRGAHFCQTPSSGHHSN